LSEIALNRFTGFSDLYNTVRPNPPKKVCLILLNLLKKDCIDTVIDLGSGSGLSTKIWIGKSKKIIGIEPNSDMRLLAEKKNPKVSFLNGSSYQTGLNDCVTDIVICSQSFHWMEPVETLKEVNRILKPNGIFAVLDCDWPVTISIKSEVAYDELFSKVDYMHKQNTSKLPKEEKWSKSNHFTNIVKSNYFAYTKEILFDNQEKCNAKRFIGIALSQGHLQTLIKSNISDINKDIEDFKNCVLKDISGTKNMLVSYRLIVAQKKS
jgi:ubiquinone/menaquinone biosynthesis C-methylase UbiE